jgi:predicted enzyme related to lactoylglutathione lyase
MISGGNTTLMVADFDRAVRFYTETLGLKLKNRFGNEWAEVETPGLTIGLHPAREGTPSGGASHISIGLGVDDLDAAVSELRQRGLEFQPVRDAGDAGRFAAFSDPDGTALYLHQDR